MWTGRAFIFVTNQASNPTLSRISCYCRAGFKIRRIIFGAERSGGAVFENFSGAERSDGAVSVKKVGAERSGGAEISKNFEIFTIFYVFFSEICSKKDSNTRTLLLAGVLHP